MNELHPEGENIILALWKAKMSDKSEKYQVNIRVAFKPDVCVLGAANEHEFPLSFVRLSCLNNPKSRSFRTIPILDLNLCLFGFRHPVWTHLCWCLWLCCCLNVAPDTLTGSHHCRQEVANTNMTQLLSAPNKLYTFSRCCCFLLMDVNVGSVATDNQPVSLKL